MALVGEMQYLTIGNDTYSLPTGGGGGGSVTSVAVSNATNGGLSVSGSPITSSGTISIGHSNVLTSAQTTQAVYPITIDKNGHIASYGSAVNIEDEIFTVTYDSTSYSDARAAFNAGKYLICLDPENGVYAPLAYESSNILGFKGVTSGSGFAAIAYTLNSSNEWSSSSTSITDEKVKWTSSTTSNTYYPLQSTLTASTSTANTIDGVSFYQYYNTAGGYRRLDLGNSTAYKSSGGAYGTIRLYGAAATYYGDLVPGVLGTTSGDGHISANRTWTLPDKTGTVALTSDIPTVPTNVSAFTNDAGYTTNTGTVTSVGISNGGGLSVSGSPITGSGSITIGHSNSVTAQTTQAVYPIKIDAQGHISAYGSAVTIPTITLNGSATTSPSFYAPTTAGENGQVLISSGSGAPTWKNIGFSNVTTDSATITLAGQGYSFSRVDEKLKVTTLNTTTQTTYPIVLSYSSTSETKYSSSGFKLTHNDGTSSVEGKAILIIGTNNAKGTTGNQTGSIYLYGDTAYRIELKADSPTSNQPITFPDKSGTIALTSDIPSVPVTDVTVGGTSVVSSGTAAIPAIPTVPTNVSAFNNDAGYLTSHQTIPVTDVKMNNASIVTSGVANITDSSGNMSINGSLTTGNIVFLPNGYALKSHKNGDTTTERYLIGYTSANNLAIGQAAQAGDYVAGSGGGITSVYGRAIEFYTGESGSVSYNGGFTSGGNLYTNGSITAHGHGTQIGYKPDQTSNTASYASSTSWRVLTTPTLELTAGTWVIIATVDFTGNTTGDRGVGITYNSTSGNIAHSRHTQRAGNYTSIADILHGVVIQTITANRTYQVEIFQNSGSSLSTTARLNAVRIA